MNEKDVQEFNAIKKLILNAVLKFYDESYDKKYTFFRPSTIIYPIEKSTNISELFRGLAEAEAVIVSKIDEALKKINKQEPIFKQKKVLARVTSLIDILIEMNAAILNIAPQLINLPENKNVLCLAEIFEMDTKRDIFENIQTINPDATQSDVNISYQNSHIFLDKMRDCILIGLMKANFSNRGAYFIKKIIDIFNEKKHHISLMVNYKSKSSSLEISPCSMLAYAKKGSFVPNSTVQQRAKEIEKNKGASSALALPVWPSGGEDLMDVFGIYFKDPALINTAMQNLIGGSFSFDKDGNVFYTPFSGEIFHELIHALHNSRGSNRANVHVLTQEEVEIWKDAEEYWTITGGNITENYLAGVSSSPSRFGHNGFSAAAIRVENEDRDVVVLSPSQIFHQ